LGREGGAVDGRGLGGGEGDYGFVGGGYVGEGEESYGVAASVDNGVCALAFRKVESELLRCVGFVGGEFSEIRDELNLDYKMHVYLVRVQNCTEKIGENGREKATHS
jgi:hypothetical protein